MRAITFLSSIAVASACFAATPTTQPAPQPQVMVFAFTSTGQKTEPWIAKAIEGNLIAELARGGSLQPDVAPVSESQTTDAVGQAREHGADYVIVGSYQTIDDELRATGEVIATADGRVLGGLTATGAMRDLFNIEDTLALQAKRLLVPSAAASTVASATVQPIQPTGPVTQAVPTVTNIFQPAVYQPAPQTYVPEYNQYAYYSIPYSYPIYYYFPSCGYGGGGFHHHGGDYHHAGNGGVGGHIKWGGAGVVGHAGW